MTVTVVKLGGHALDATTNAGLLLDALATDLLEMQRDGDVAVLIHGGGPQISDLMKRLGKETEFRNVNDQLGYKDLVVIAATSSFDVQAWRVYNSSAPPRGGGKDPGARRPTRDELDEMRMGSDFMRKGGKVGSASRRADGIAMRGKTRGKYI